MGLFDALGGKPTPEKFGDEMLRRFRSTPGITSADIDRQAFRIHYTDAAGSKGFLQLANAFAEYQAVAKGQREAVIAKYLSTLSVSAEGKLTFETARPRLLPILRHKSYFGLSELSMTLTLGPPKDGAPAPTVPRQDFAGDIALGVAIDSPQTMAVLSGAHLAEWGRDFGACLAAAVDNLRDLGAGKFRKLSPGLFTSTWGDSYDASRALLTDIFSRLEVRGDPVIALPSTNQVLVAGSQDEKALEGLAVAAMEGLSAAPRQLSAMLLRLEGGRWTPFRLPGPAGERLEGARYALLQRDANDQKRILEEHYKKTGQDIFVAQYTVFQAKGSGRSMSGAVLTIGAVSTIPVAERMFIVNPQTKEVLDVPWEKAVEILGSKLRAEAMFPPRVFVESQPDEEEIRKLREVASKVPGQG